MVAPRSSIPSLSTYLSRNIRNIYGIPLNLLVVSVFLSIKSLGVKGALGCATAALAVSSLCMNLLNAGVGAKQDKLAA